MSDSAADYLEAGKAVGRECLEAALAYVALGWPALGLCPPDHVGVGREHGKDCESPGKVPLPNFGRWKAYQDRLPTEAELRRWWEESPTMNVGVAMGNLPRLIGLDPDGPAGEARLQEMSGGDLPPTLEFRTPGGGRRLLYRIPDGADFRPTAEAIGKGDELRFLAHGSQTVMPPSRHVSGGRYAWVSGRGPGEIEAAAAPAWLVAHMTARSSKDRLETIAAGEVIPEGTRDSRLTRMAGVMRERGFDEEAIVAALRVTNERCDPPLPEQQVRKIARSVSKYSPNPYLDTVIRTECNGKAAHEALDVEEILGLGLTPMSNLQPQPLRWLVPGYLPLGKLVLLAGDGGHGKSTITLHVAARLSVGALPFGLIGGPREPCSSLLVSCEDDYEDTILPRLMCAGADLSRIYRVDGIQTKDGKLTPFSLVHYDAIEGELKRRSDVKLVVIDPAGAFIGRSGVDDHKDSELRALLGPLTELAARRAVSILLVKHLNKTANASAVHRVGGSVGYVNAVRAALVVAPDPEEDGRKLLLPLKFNIGPKPSALRYRLQDLAAEEKPPILAQCTELTDDDKTALAQQLFRIAWLGPVDASADEVMAKPTTSKVSASKREEAADWIVAYLANGARSSDDVIEAGKKMGFSRGTLFNARNGMKNLVRARRQGRGWVWEVIEEMQSDQENDGDEPLEPLNS
jgi:hypothetical protein